MNSGKLLRPVGQSGTASEAGRRCNDLASTTVSRKWRGRLVVGLARALSSSQLGLLTKPSLSRSVLATCNSQRQPSGSLLSCARISSVAVGRRSWSIGKASAHDAQWAPGQVRAAERRPYPPNLIGSVVMSRAITSCSWSWSGTFLRPVLLCISLIGKGHSLNT